MQIEIDFSTFGQSHTSDFFRVHAKPNWHFYETERRQLSFLSSNSHLSTFILPIMSNTPMGVHREEFAMKT